jgi:hypothetical protein
MAISVKTTLGTAAAVLALAVPAQAAEITEQPENVRRGEVVQVVWTGESSDVVVERRYGLDWLTDESEVRVEDLGDGAWSARWQPTYFTPAGTYRIQVDGVTSDEFRVRPCICVLPNPVKARWRKGRYRLSLTAEYAPGPPDGFIALPRRVKTGRPLVRVMRDGQRVGTVRLRYRRKKFRGKWRGERGPRHSLVFQLVTLTDAYRNR